MAGFCYSANAMNPQPTPSATGPALPFAHGITDGATEASGRTGSDNAGQVLQQLRILRDTPIPSAERVKLLDLLYRQAERIVGNERACLHGTTLPVSRRLRQRIKTLLDLQEMLAQDYLNALAALFDPQQPGDTQTAHDALRCAIQLIQWRLQISQMLAAPPPPGIWQQLHAAYRTASRLGVDQLTDQHGTASIHRLYTRILLVAIAQPASFSSDELDFIACYVDHCVPTPALTTAPAVVDGEFWIDPEKDAPAHAMVRRMPGADSPVLYLNGNEAAEAARRHHALLVAGSPATAFGFPETSLPGNAAAILKRLHRLWGSPAKRRFPRRRQSYRAQLCIGLENLNRHLGQSRPDARLSEWMVINESPDGYALMHMAGEPGELRVGDIVALRPMGDSADACQDWQVSIIRWALSENPEHIELGLQILSSRAMAAEAVLAAGEKRTKVPALILPATPPLKPEKSLVLPTGAQREINHPIVVLMDKGDGRIGIHEMHATHLDEQTIRVDILSVSPVPPR